MKIAVVCFTKKGGQTAEKLVAGLKKSGHETAGFVKTKHCDSENTLTLIEEPLKDWVKKQFEEDINLIFIGAAGIAVRMIAPCLRGKDRDPAVVVIDEMGTYSISLLSGHIGGANDLANEAADVIAAIPVITTATDLNNEFAVDVFAIKNRLAITCLQYAREISAAVLRGETVGFSGDFPVTGELPKALSPDVQTPCRFRITVQYFENDTKTLYLVPQAVILGIGCRRGTSSQAIAEAVNSFLLENRICREALAGIASIDLKKEEQGLIEYAEEQGLTFQTYAKEKLEQMEGDFTESEFVREVTGISNVCERAAVCGCEGAGRLLIRKTVFTGITVAAAVKDMTFSF